MPRKYTEMRAKTCLTETCIRIANTTGYCDRCNPTVNKCQDFITVALNHESDDCLHWPYAKTKCGYGEIVDPKTSRHWRAHRPT